MWRFRRALKHAARAEEMLKGASIRPGRVNIRFLLPWIENASLEQEDQDLSERWAALLASAASAGGHFAVNHQFPRILATLARKEARLLDIMFDEGSKSWVRGSTSKAPDLVSRDSLMDREQMAKVLGRNHFRWRSNQERDIALEDLINQGLVRTQQIIDPQSYPALAGKIFAAGQLTPPWPLGADVMVHMRSQFQMTVTGVHFVIACRAPGSASTAR